MSRPRRGPESRAAKSPPGNEEYRLQVTPPKSHARPWRGRAACRAACWSSWHSRTRRKLILLGWLRPLTAGESAASCKTCQEITRSRSRDYSEGEKRDAWRWHPTVAPTRAGASWRRNPRNARSGSAKNPRMKHDAHVRRPRPAR